MANGRSINNQHEYWDRVADEKTFTISVDIDFLKRHLEPGAGILDFGCGYGRICAELADAGFTNVTGVDSAPGMIRRARSLNPGIRFELLESASGATTDRPGRASGDGFGLRVTPAGFDAVLLVAVLTCIPDDDAQQALIASLTDLLRPGGLLCVSDFVLQNDDRNLDRYERFAGEFGAYGVFRLDEGAVVRHHTPEYLARLLSSFDTIEQSFPEVVTMNGHRATSFHWVGRKATEE